MLLGMLALCGLPLWIALAAWAVYPAVGEPAVYSVWMWVEHAYSYYETSTLMWVTAMVEVCWLLFVFSFLENKLFPAKAFVGGESKQ